ncbi:MAG: hypothetical protein Q4B22_00180 [Eubacteriales bacterium]|nr:hypothetical protein [Eubacteriales bacterium]
MHRAENTKWKRGSLTVEAAAVVPLFFLAVVVLIGMLGFYGRYADTLIRMQEQAERSAAVINDAGGRDYVDLQENVHYVPQWFPAFLPVVQAPVRVRVHAWNGRENGFLSTELTADHEAEELVYMTPNGSVYHTSTQCGSLALHIRRIPAEALSHERNASGGRYHACERCVGSGMTGSSVYVTEDGDRYHNAADCSGLTRTIRIVSREEAEGLRECSFCQRLHG